MASLGGCAPRGWDLVGKMVVDEKLNVKVGFVGVEIEMLVLREVLKEHGDKVVLDNFGLERYLVVWNKWMDPLLPFGVG